MKLELSENKVLEENEKAQKDTQQLLSSLGDVQGVIELIRENEQAKGAFNSMHLSKGKKIWLELEVEDSWMSGMILSWLYQSSEHDGQPLHALGCSIKTIYFQKPGFSDTERGAIQQLYKTVFGDNNQHQ